MKITIAALILCVCFAVPVLAQNQYSIKGFATDSASRTSLSNATICILNAKDSIISKFVYTKEGGAFSINGLAPGSFVLLVSYPDYADYAERFTLDAAHPAHNFGAINMQLKSRLLHEVIIKGEVNAIKIKGDTTEFNAKAYVIQKNDKVEDLLKQLPGIQIDKDGKITANGQAVNKVLVDGDEFFGDDPTLVTKNLRADMVDKVQLYNKKSDQAAFTGIDDGQTTKTINIQLKQDKKNGTFGKLDGGGGIQERYEAQAIYNRFKAKQKYSAYGTSANNGKTGLGYQDNSSLGTTGNNVIIGDGGSISIFDSGDDGLDSFDGSYFGTGKPVAHSGGLHFDNKWGAADKYTLNTNYKAGSLDVTGVTTTNIQQNLTNGSITTNSDQRFDNNAFRQKLDMMYQVKFDTTATLKLSADGTLKNFSVLNTYNTTTLNTLGGLINRNNRNITNSGDQQIFNLSGFLTKKFLKVGRTFSWNVVEAYNDNQAHGYLNSEIDFYNQTTGNRDSLQLTNQFKRANALSSVFSSNMTYSEPLSKIAALLINYGLGLNNSTADRRSYNQSAAGVYDILDPVYSNDYKFLQTTNQFGGTVNFKTKKVSANFGTKASLIDFSQTDEFTGNAYRRNFINWLPQAYFQYRPSLQRSISFNYNGYTSQPTIDQIQPIRTNNDPLNITIGNANLKPSFSQSFNFNYNSSKALSGSSTFFYGYFSTRYNSVVNNTTTDATTGKTVIQYVNLNNNTPINYNASFSTSRKIKPVAASLGIRLNTAGSINYSYINNTLNTSETYTYGASLNFSKNIARKYSIYINGGPSYNINKFSLNSAINNNSTRFTAYGSGTYYLPAKFIFDTNINYIGNTKTQVLPASNITAWNVTLSKAFFKDENLKFSVLAADILNQNRNFYRSVQANTITQTNSTSIGRYVMFMITWDFTKFKTTPDKK